MANLTTEVIECIVKKCLESSEMKITSLIEKVTNLEAKIVELRSEFGKKQQAVVVQPSLSYAETASKPTASKTTAKTPEVPLSRPPTARAQRAQARNGRSLAPVVTAATNDVARKSLSTPPAATTSVSKSLQPGPSNRPTIITNDKTVANEKGTACGEGSAVAKCDVIINNHIENDKEPYSNKWQDAHRKNRHHPSRAVVQGTGCIDPELKTVERNKKIHVCFLSPEISEEAMIAYMKKKNQDNHYRAEKLKLKHDFYASFGISMPTSKFDFFMDPSNWPPGTEVSEWFRTSSRRAMRPSAAAAGSRSD